MSTVLPPVEDFSQERHPEVFARIPDGVTYGRPGQLSEHQVKQFFDEVRTLHSWVIAHVHVVVYIVVYAQLVPMRIVNCISHIHVKKHNSVCSVTHQYH